MPVTSTAMIWPLAKPLRRTTWRKNASRPVPVGPPYLEGHGPAGHGEA